jgi:hypothetical protein
MWRLASPKIRSARSANGPTRKAIRNQTLGDLPRFRAISVASGIEAIETITISQDIRPSPIAISRRLQDGLSLEHAAPRYKAQSETDSALRKK